MDIENVSKTFLEALVSVDRQKASAILDYCYSENCNFSSVENIINISLEIIGEKWSKGDVSLAQVYMSGAICEELLNKYLLKSDTAAIKYPVIASAVLLDHHGLGMKIVSSVVKANGYELLNFGSGVSVEDAVKLTIGNNVDILLISVLMFPSALKVRDLCEKLKLAGSSAIIAVGGAPFRLDNSLWKKVKADAYGENASDAVKIIEKYRKANNV